jgi:hypothetical protein
MRPLVALRPLVLVLALLGTAQSAQAQRTGNDLYSWCKAPRTEWMDWGLCYGFILGVFETIVVADAMAYCGYDGATNEQLRDIVFQYLQVHPAERHEHAHYLIARAMRKALLRRAR